ncbi:UDP-glucuronic acid decarboxylase family protein [Streptomyces radiopugnans]|uniref:UDP-glucuronic acid decarboxylase family protein n=1 Tax=Streptomyces radiopugnans TaxID=403935 RepID=UPI003F1D9C83
MASVSSAAPSIRARSRVLVSGGAGFIGSHLCERLLAEGYSVIAVDNLSSGQVANLGAVLDDPEFTLLQQDITLPSLAQEACLNGALAAVVHLACPASPRDYLQHPIETLRTGSQGTLNLLELAVQKRARFVYASTSEVYGDPEVHPQPESYWGKVNPTGPRAVYNESKRFGEAAVTAYRRHRGLDSGIVRIFNTYGPRMRTDDGRVIPTLVSQSLAGAPLTIHGTGQQTRSFCYVDDLVCGLVHMLQSGQAGPVNLGNPEEISIVELAEVISEVTGSVSRVSVTSALQDDPVRRRPDISAAARLLGWEPQISLHEGLLRTVQWFRKHSTVAVG